MDNPKLLYRSKGIQPKAKTFYQVGTIFFGIGGILFILLPIITDAPSIFTFLGILYIGIGFLIPKTYQSMRNSRLFVYEDHVEGIAVSCMEANSEDLFSELSQIKTASSPERTQFCISFKEITDIQKGPMNFFVPQIIINCGSKKYNVAVKEPERAYQIICDKVFGVESAAACVSCGGEISATTETCPHCGHMTRYGKTKKGTHQIQANSNKQQITSAIGAVIFVIGLIILIPAIVDLNEISGYASLYASIYPSESRKMVVNFFLGLFVTCFGLSLPLRNWIMKKLTPHD